MVAGRMQYEKRLLCMYMYDYIYVFSYSMLGDTNVSIIIIKTKVSNVDYFQKSCYFQNQ